MDRNRRIPRIMHQIYLNGEMPTHLMRNVEDHKARNPHWEHRLYNEEAAIELIVGHYGNEMLSLYQRISDHYPAARADLLRHLIIFAYGGVYFDIKSCFDRPLDEVIREDDSYLLAQWQNGPSEQNEGWGLHNDLTHIPGGEYISYFIIAISGHPFSKAAIDRIGRNIGSYRPWSAVGRTGVLRTTGPIACTLAIYPIRGKHIHRLVTEAWLSCRPSLLDEYDHKASFQKKHYSLITEPVIKLSRFGTALSAVCVDLRSLKNRFG